MAKWETTDAAWIEACAASKARDTDMISRADAIALVEDEMPGHYLSKQTQIVTKLRALPAAQVAVSDDTLRQAIGRAWCHEENVAKEVGVDIAEAVLWEIRAALAASKKGGA